MDIWQELSIAFIYFSIVLWNSVTTFALVIAILEYIDDRHDLAKIEGEKLQFLTLIARTKLTRAKWILVSCCLMEGAGILGTIFLLLQPPVPDASIAQAMSRLVLIILPFALLKAKLADRGIRKTIRNVTEDSRE